MELIPNRLNLHKILICKKACSGKVFMEQILLQWKSIHEAMSNRSFFIFSNIKQDFMLVKIIFHYGKYALKAHSVNDSKN